MYVYIIICPYIYVCILYIYVLYIISFRNSQLLHNPHLRAKLTQLLSLMIPQEEDETRQTIQPSVRELLSLDLADLPTSLIPLLSLSLLPNLTIGRDKEIVI